MKYSFIALSLLILLTSINVSAASETLTSEIEKITLLERDNSIMIQMPVHRCSKIKVFELNSGNTFSTEESRSHMLAMLLSAKSLDRAVAITFDNEVFTESAESQGETITYQKILNIEYR